MAVDFGIYAFLFFCGLGLSVAKGIAYICGTLISFTLNARLTFKKKLSSLSLCKFSALYGLSFISNVLINSLIFKLSDNFIFAYLVSLGVAVVINFIGQKWWVFR